MSDFVHLHVHSEYSLLDGLIQIPNLVAKAAEYKMPALALTDHGAMYGSFQFYKYAKKAGVKPIIGFEAYMAKRSRLEKDTVEDKDRYHLTLLAKNNQGYKNLMKLTTLAHLEGYYYKPRIDFEILEKYKEGLIVLSGCMQGMVSKFLREEKDDEAEKTVKKFLDMFGEDYYIELQRHPAFDELEKINKKLLALSRKFGIPVVATNDVHYLNEDDAYAQEILLCIQTQHTILEKNRPISMIDSPDFYLKSPEEMKKLFADIPEAIENTVKIAEKCNVTMGSDTWILPKFKTPDNLNPEEYLRKLTYEKIPTRFKELTPEIKTRLDYELDVICTKGYATYFLIVQDFVNWAKDTGITVGPGRGSVAGSLVSYVLNITAINPLQMVIPFERFLNPHRPSPPDIDMDFADDRRDEVIAYVTKKYGEDKVAQIITFGTMEARAAIRDAGRALGMPYSAPDRIAKLIPQGAQGFSMNLEKALEMSPDLKNAYDNEEETKKLIDLAQKLEGVSRHASVHAAGVVISDGPLTDYVPIQKETRFGKIITQYDMYSLDLNAAPDGIAVGLMKMDFLGLRNLSILEKALKYVQQLHGVKIILNDIPLDDKPTFDLIATGDTTGVFQLESAGMRRLGRNLKPNKFSDISAMVALYRPGPMQWIDEFIAGKQNPQKIRYPHPALKQVLNETYGIAVYQEQCMQIANVMAGYSMAEADRLRMAIGKKKKELMVKEKAAFIDGCVKNGYTPLVAEKVFSLIEKFVGYGFNKAHSACYGMIAYWTAYMKAHYPVEFMTALLTAENNGAGAQREDKLRVAIEECRKIKLGILPPDINKSVIDFSIEERTKIRFGLSAVKNVGSAAISSIVTARDAKPFASIYDFVSRVDLSKVNKKTMESLIKVGAMDMFGPRAALITGLSEIMLWAQKKKKDADSAQGSLFAEEIEEKEPMLPKVENFNKRELLNLEKELLGFYLTEHPLQSKIESLAGQKVATIAQVSTFESGKKIRLPVLVTRIKSILTKKNNSEMIFATLEDLTGTIDAVVFPTTYAKTRSFWYKDAALIVSGSVNRRDDKLSVLVDNIYPLDL